MEKSLMLGRIEGMRRRRQQRMRWLDGITKSVDINFSKLWELVKDRVVWHATVTKSQTQLSDWTTAATMAGGLPGRRVVELLSPAKCWTSVLHAQTPNGDCRTLVHALTSTSCPHGRVKKERRSSLLHLPSQCLSSWAAAVKMDWTLVWWAGKPSQVSSAEVWNTAALASGRKRNAVYQH